MELTSAHLIYFSPTFTSKQVAGAIVQGTAIQHVSVTNITYASPGTLDLPADSLVIIAVPVYGGHVPPLALKRLEKIRGNHTPVVLVAVYGNRAYEKALMELDMYASRHGFHVIAGATFIGEHSFSTETNPVSPGRPDKDDLIFAECFGQKIIEKIRNAADNLTDGSKNSMGFFLMDHETITGTLTVGDQFLNAYKTWKKGENTTIKT